MSGRITMRKSNNIPGRINDATNEMEMKRACLSVRIASGSSQASREARTTHYLKKSAPPSDKYNYRTVHTNTIKSESSERVTAGSCTGMEGWIWVND